MSTIFKTGHLNAGKKFVAGRKHFEADEFGLVTVDDPQIEAEWASVFQVYDPKNPDLTDAVSYLKKQKQMKEDALIRLDEPDEPIVPVKKSKEKPAPKIEAKEEEKKEEVKTDSTDTQEPEKVPGKPWLSRTMDTLKGS